MAESESRPFLLLSDPARAAPRAENTKGGGGPKMPRKPRQVVRLAPQFQALEDALERKAVALQADPTGTAPEQVLVFEVRGSVTVFVDLVSKTDGLQWLADEYVDDFEPDEDFYDSGGHHREQKGHLYLTMTDQAALQQFLSLWRQWKADRPMQEEHRPWQAVFRQLHTIRPWDVEDRLRETGLREDWAESKEDGADTVQAELELWYRPSPEQRAEGELRVRARVARAGGQVLARCAIPDIEYHAVLVRFPITAADDILAHRDVHIATCDDVFVFRPAGQAIRGLDTEVEIEAATPAPPSPTGEPVVGLLDGLPIENHAHLAGRLRVDDPEQWAETYPVAARRHGTEMASLILHGDLNAQELPLARKLYVAPVFRAAEGLKGWEEVAPADRLWTDVIHSAVRRAVVGDGEHGPSAPAVAVFNLSIGVKDQPFVRSIRPLARLLDWLSWEHRVLFIVSAGNHPKVEFELSDEHLAAEEDTQRAVLQQLHGRRRLHRLLPPAESVNALTVGAVHRDEESRRPPTSPGSDDRRLLVHASGIPAPYGALGQGFRRSVKPDVLAPGGRALYRRGMRPPRSFALLPDGRPVGQRVAAPGLPGEIGGTRLTFGTSNAAALVTRLAARLYDPVQALVADRFPDVPIAVWLKALIVHTARWPRDAFDALSRAVKTDTNARRFRDEVTAFLGYGAIDPERAFDCTQHRVTLLGGGTIAADETWIHAVPLPALLHTVSAWRQLTVTLAWLTPINPRHHRYRRASLSFTIARDSCSTLGIKSSEAGARATKRGTVQHQVFEGTGVINLSNEQPTLEIPVSCQAQAGQLEDRVPYAVVCTLELEPDLLVDLYTEIRERLRVPVRAVVT